MKDYQQRVIDEHADLSEKLDKLEVFFFSEQREALPEKEQGLLSAQLHTMLSYKHILAERIELFS